MLLGFAALIATGLPFAPLCVTLLFLSTTKGIVAFNSSSVLFLVFLLVLSAFCKWKAFVNFWRLIRAIYEPQGNSPHGDLKLMPLQITKIHYDAIRAHGAQDYPHECCGFLVGKTDGDTVTVTRTVPAANTREDSPRNRFEIDPGELVKTDRAARGRGARRGRVLPQPPGCACRTVELRPGNTPGRGIVTLLSRSAQASRRKCGTGFCVTTARVSDEDAIRHIRGD